MCTGQSIPWPRFSEPIEREMWADEVYMKWFEHLMFSLSLSGLPEDKSSGYRLLQLKEWARKTGS